MMDTETKPNAPITDNIPKWASRLVGLGADWPSNNRPVKINISVPNLLAGVGNG